MLEYKKIKQNIHRKIMLFIFFFLFQIQPELMNSKEIRHQR